MAIPKHDEMYIIFLKSLEDGMQYSVKEICQKIIEELKLTDEEIKERTAGGKVTVISSRIRWTRAYLKKAGAIKSPKIGELIITERGKQLLKDYPDKIDNSVLMQFDSFREFVKPKKTKDIIKNNDVDTTPQDKIDTSFRQINNNLIDELLEEIMRQNAVFFESLVLKLLLKMGYGGTVKNASTLTKQSGDEGIDGIIKEDKLGFELIFIQAKRWNIDVAIGRPEIQKFVGALGGQGAKKGLFITTARFTKEAYEYSNKQHTAKVVLIDGIMLAKYMIENNLGVSTEQVYEIKKIDMDFFDEE